MPLFRQKHDLSSLARVLFTNAWHDLQQVRASRQPQDSSPMGMATWIVCSSTYGRAIPWPTLAVAFGLFVRFNFIGEFFPQVRGMVLTQVDSALADAAGDASDAVFARNDGADITQRLNAKLPELALFLEMSSITQPELFQANLQHRVLVAFAQDRVLPPIPDPSSAADHEFATALNIVMGRAVSNTYKNHKLK